MDGMGSMGAFGAGVVLGGVGGLFGIGGGLMAIPVLAGLFGLDQTLAQGTALVMIAPNVLLGFCRYRQRNPIDLRAAGLLGGSAIVSTYVTARLATLIDARSLRLQFVCFLVGLALLLMWGTRQSGRRAAETPSRAPLGRRWLSVLGLGSGVFSGLFTVGGGLVTTPVLTGFFGVRRQTTAQGLALAAVAPGALVALMTYAAAGKVQWALGLPLAAGGLLSVSWGVRLAHSLPERLLRWLFCVLLLATAGVMW